MINAQSSIQSDVSPTTKHSFWPIQKNELKKFLPMSFLMFGILFNQNILRILKDSILISEISAEAVSFAKVYCVTPVAALLVIIYAKLVNHFSFQQIFNILTIAFVGFFAFFAFWLYPNTHYFHMDPADLQSMMEAYPNFKWYIALVGNWGFIVFYTLCELWPNIFYVLLFWQCANEISTTEQAKRFYTLFSLFGNSSLVIVGALMMNLASEATLAKHLFNLSSDKVALVQASTTLVCIFAIFSCFMVTFVRRRHDSLTSQGSGKAKKQKLGLVQSFKYIINSKYLWLMLICSASFGLSMNLVEAVWKAKMKELYPSVNSYAEYNSLYIMWTGVMIMAMTIVGNYLMRKYSWLVSAIIAPLLILVTGVLFFILVIADSHLNWQDYAIVTSPLALAVTIGTIQNVLSKGTKYSLWDTSREMLYIPLDQELKTKGKAAVDVVSSKIGKSTSGLVQSLIFTIIPTATFTSISPILLVVFVVVCILWIDAIKKVYAEYRKFGLS